MSIQLDRLEIAQEIAVEAQSESKWKQLGELAMSSGKLQMAVECMKYAMDISGLLLLYSSIGDAEGVSKLATRAKEQGKNNVAYLCLFMLGRLEDCLDLLVERIRIPEAALMARSYLPSKVSEIVALWRKDLNKQNLWLIPRSTEIFLKIGKLLFPSKKKLQRQGNQAEYHYYLIFNDPTAPDSTAVAESKLTPAEVRTVKLIYSKKVVVKDSAAGYKTENINDEDVSNEHAKQSDDHVNHLEKEPGGDLIESKEKEYDNNKWLFEFIPLLVERLMVLPSHSVWFLKMVQLVLNLSSSLASQTVTNLPFSAHMDLPLPTRVKVVGFLQGRRFPQRREKITRNLPSQLTRLCLNILIEDGESVVKEKSKSPVP
ncbi:unnamed protein product [Eruca vesicaria subsp. sativa]|uniref:COPA/B TPR domain-containing protein n=1 Tax=Eruca vesicaria subsp. sativa TaxID=29727 RepID=A0ABC8K7X7_ERUVS|nr:unnamed protein product [Eruca vesicaria subsp. sativa]